MYLKKTLPKSIELSLNAVFCCKKENNEKLTSSVHIISFQAPTIYLTKSERGRIIIVYEYYLAQAIYIKKLCDRAFIPELFSPLFMMNFYA